MGYAADRLFDPGFDTVNTAGTVVNSTSGAEVIGQNGSSEGVTLSAQQSLSGAIEGYVGGDLSAFRTVTSTAHEVRHIRRYLLGLPSLDEYKMTFVRTPGGLTATLEHDPSGPVNIETSAAEREAEANYDPFHPWQQ